MSRSPKATARNPFGTYQEVGFVLTVLSDPLEHTTWTSLPCRDMRVDWESFFRNAPFNIDLLQSALELGWKESKISSAGYLVGASRNLFFGMRQLDALPTSAEIAAQVRLMRNALARFAALSQGLSATADMLAEPHWLASKPLGSAAGMEDSWLAALHPVLQMTIEAADAPPDADKVSPERHQRNLAIYQARQIELQGFFTAIPDILHRLDRTIARSEAMAQGLPRPRFKGAPGDLSRDWLLIRLMWIWRDALARDLTIYLPRIKDRTARDDLTPDGCLGFILSVLADVEPVEPDKFSALERKLIELRRRVPDKPLVNSRLE